MAAFRGFSLPGSSRAYAGCPGSLVGARQTPGKQFRQRGLAQIGLAPILISSRYVAHLRSEDARQTVIVGCGKSREWLPRPARGGRVGVRGGTGRRQFGRLAQTQSLGARGIDARLRQRIADQGTNLDPGSERAATEDLGRIGTRRGCLEPRHPGVTRPRHGALPTAATAARNRWSRLPGRRSRPLGRVRPPRRA